MSGRAVTWRAALLAAGASALFTLLVYAAARRWGVHGLDERLVEAISWRARSHGLTSAENMGDIRTMYDLAPYTLVVAVFLASLLWRRQAQLAALMGGMLLGANLSTWVLQHRLGDPRVVALLDEPSWATYWPSGHTTAAVALGAAAVMVSTPRWRGFAAVASVLVTSLAVLTNLMLRVHVPTDVLGGIGVAATWVFLALAAQLRWPQLQPR